MRRRNGWIWARSVVYHGDIWMVVEGVCCHFRSWFRNRLVFDFGREFFRGYELARKYVGGGTGRCQAVVSVGHVPAGD